MRWLRGFDPTLVLVVANVSGLLGILRRRRESGRWRGVMGSASGPIYRTPAFLVAVTVSAAIAVVMGLVGNTTACVVAIATTAMVIVGHLLLTERLDGAAEPDGIGLSQRS